MFAYEMHRMRHAELLREADAQRLARQAAGTGRTGRLFGRRSAGGRSGGQESEGRVNGERDRFVRAA